MRTELAMTAGVPWSVNAVERETWAAARDAARRAGLSVGEWLEQTIREGADEPSGCNLSVVASRHGAGNVSPTQTADPQTSGIVHCM